MHPVLSIITVNLNDKEGLEKTISSVVAQTFCNYEFIVIDGGSSDGSAEIIKKFSEKITFSVSEKDNGPYDAMNKGIAKASGDFCLFLNSGDIFCDSHVLKNIFSRDFSEDIIYGNMMFDGGNAIRVPGLMPDKISVHQMLTDTLWHPVSFIRRSLFQKFGMYNIEYKIVADYEFFFRTIIMNGVLTKHIPLFISVFKNFNGLSSTIDNHAQIKSEKEKIITSNLSRQVLETEESNRKTLADKPLVSVVIPAYNYAHLIGETLQSIICQSYIKWECIVVDNGSTDNTKEVVESYGKIYNRIKYFSQPNTGPSSARNYGISLSSGEFIQFLDADDLLEKEKFEKEVEIMAHHPYQIVYSDMRYFPSGAPDRLFHTMSLNSENDLPWMKKISGKGNEVSEFLMKENIMVINSPLIRKSVFEKVGFFDVSLRFNEDWDLWVRCALNDIYFYFHDDLNTKALVRVHASSYSKDRFKMYLYGLKVCLKINADKKAAKFKKILLSKIIYHQKVLDSNLRERARKENKQAAKMSLILYKETGLYRYRMYVWLLNYFPLVFYNIISGMLYLSSKLYFVINYGM
jgi:glycosyltransferase involved in cell wall biosynthesis